MTRYTRTWFFFVTLAVTAATAWSALSVTSTDQMVEAADAGGGPLPPLSPPAEQNPVTGPVTAMSPTTTAAYVGANAATRSTPSEKRPRHQDAPSSPPLVAGVSGDTLDGSFAVVKPNPEALREDLPEGEDTSPGRYRETPDVSNAITYPSGPQSSGMTQGTGPERLRFSVFVTQDDDGMGKLKVSLTNTSGRTIRFTDGLYALGDVTREGQPWRQFVLSDPAVTALAPGQEASVRTSFLFEGHGYYSSSGSVEIELV